MLEFHLTSTERESGLSGDRLLVAVDALNTDGVIVLHDAIHPDHIAALRDKMLADVEVILARDDAPFNFNVGNVQQDPPPFAPFLFRDVLFNEAVISVTHAVLGDGLHNSFYSGNTAIKGGDRQPVHPDFGQLWPNLEHAPPAYCLAINIPLVDFKEENGATELWPGTHRDTTYYHTQGSARVAEEHLARWKNPGPIRALVPAGSAIIRDLRMWHAGMPNHTHTPRPMLAMIHFPSWWTAFAPIVVPETERAFFEHPILRTNARFVEGDVAYLLHGEAYDVSK